MARNLSPIDEPEEIEAFQLLGAFGGERTRELLGRRDAFAVRGGGGAGDARRRRSVSRNRSAGRAEGSGLGSNNWVIGPGRSAAARRGSPTIRTWAWEFRAVWYAARLESPDYSVSGVTLAGAPGVILGRGPHVAWGFTNLYVDDFDVFVEELDASGTPGPPRRRLAQTGRTKPETIRMKDEVEVTVDVRQAAIGESFSAPRRSAVCRRAV